MEITCDNCRNYDANKDVCLKYDHNIGLTVEECFESKQKEEPVKHIYYVVRDKEIIQTYVDNGGIHPVYAIKLMAEELSERMQKDQEGGEE